MSSFNDIKKQIEEAIESKQTPTAVAGKISPELDDKGMPDINAVKIKGTPVSKPGTERVLLDASSFQFMECASAAVGYEKQRYCVVEKGVPAQYGNHYINSKGERTHVLTKDAFTLLLGIMNNIVRQLKKNSDDLAFAQEQRDLYKLTIDALKKNGIID